MERLAELHMYLPKLIWNFKFSIELLGRLIGCQNSQLTVRDFQLLFNVKLISITD